MSCRRRGVLLTTADPSDSITMPKQLSKFIIIIAASVLFIYCLAVIFIWQKQETLLFHPDPLAADYQFNLPYTHEIYIDVPGAKIHALHLQLPREQNRGIVLFLHGNAENLKEWFTNPDFWISSGYDVLMIDYRGYGKSTGRIDSEEQLHSDALAAWNYIKDQYAGKNKVIYGRSLGTALAAKLATQVTSDLVVLVSPYTSMKDMAHQYYPWVPGFVLRYPLENNKYIKQIATPILLLHGNNDQLINMKHSQELVTLNSRARFIKIPNAGHGDIHNFSLYTKTLHDALVGL